MKCVDATPMRSCDLTGNRLSATTGSGWLYNDNNQLLSNTEGSYEYDANGNVVSVTKNGQMASYLYDARNRLIQATLPNNTSVAYDYDPFGRRISKTIGSQTIYYVYTDEGLVGEYSNSGSMQTVYGWQPDGVWGTDPLYMMEDGKYYWYHNDHLGTPQRMSDSTGAVAWSAMYSAFGQAVVAEQSTLMNNCLLCRICG